MTRTRRNRLLTAAALALFLLVLGVTTGFDPDILFLYRPIPY
jgi:hypothetical protein